MNQILIRENSILHVELCGETQINFPNNLSRADVNKPFESC